MRNKEKISIENASNRSPEMQVEVFQTPVISQPARSNYNPINEGLAAKVWELLRRNPDFRHITQEIFKLNPSRRPDRDQLIQQLDFLDKQNPFAGFAIRWFFRPKYLDFYFPRQPHDFLKPLDHESFIEIGQFWLSEEWLHRLEEILSDEEDSFSGPLTNSPSPFCLDTAWPNTPALFQFLFSWLWETYDLDGVNISFADSNIKNGEIDTDEMNIKWDFLHIKKGKIDPLTRSKLLRIKVLLENHILFAIPKIIMTRKVETRLKNDFNCVLANMKAIDIRRYPSFLGKESEWKIFDFCRAKISYERDSKHPHPIQPQSYGSIVFQEYNRLLKSSGKMSEKSKWEAHTRDGYEKMEKYMFAVFPAFNFQKLIEFDFPLNSKDQILNVSALALQGALQKLQFIAPHFRIF